MYLLHSLSKNNYHKDSQESLPLPADAHRIWKEYPPATKTFPLSAEQLAGLGALDSLTIESPPVKSRVGVSRKEHWLLRNVTELHCVMAAH